MAPARRARLPRGAQLRCPPLRLQAPALHPTAAQDEDEWRQWKQVCILRTSTDTYRRYTRMDQLKCCPREPGPARRARLQTTAAQITFRTAARRQVGDPVMHIELRRWADILIIAPLSANTLAKAANGMCDNLLTCVVRAWDFQRPLLVRGAARRGRAQVGRRRGRGQPRGCFSPIPVPRPLASCKQPLPAPFGARLRQQARA